MTRFPIYRHAGTAAFLDSEEGQRYMARLNGVVWQAKPFCVVSSYIENPGMSRKFAGQGKPLTIRHVETGEVFASAVKAKERFGVCTVTILKYARAGLPTRAGTFEIVGAA